MTDSKPEIRALSYPNIGDETTFSARKWKHPKDDIFNTLADYVDDENKIRIADFLNLFYYFMICYSKTCFKKKADWIHRHSLYNNDTLFRYELANALDSHAKILDIQSRMYIYRNEFKRKQPNDYLTTDKIKELILFINESLDLLCTDISEPVVLISNDIKQKLSKYQSEYSEKKKRKKSTKLNYDVINKLVAEGVITLQD